MKIGITFSAFDLLHAGHIKMLEDAKEQCDFLICGLQTDPTLDRPEKNKPTQTVFERYMQLKGCKHVDKIIPYATEQDLEDILRSYKIHVRILGDEYMYKSFTGRAYCEEKGIELYFNRRENRFSSSSLRRIIANKQEDKQSGVVHLKDNAEFQLQRAKA
ncbi:glycerol-3-phosphate cytidylyltransferase [Sphingobacterium allocomposti]|uniref:Glycerol-3-phosphate cytidylyltransferase n=1 Tax=Sphingobacterium allocomposti TaxID=415956 RepID=A0A5S5DNI7_9SPHI|nr:adenylyltransferase/cytidyltransferase family protein [Sphingobacterium composti Yoo et al. 2007 non Ten et al. 2007]TYP96606.1 glycerol-3-phosphate cytidylyltransferase [Sphingobacterium composti Yoo et al. 2007 non Ten et al. 2007]